MHIFDINPPPSLPVTLDSAKTFLRVDGPDEDDLIRDLIVAAQGQIETRLGQSLITRAQRMCRAVPDGQVLYLSRFPASEITAIRIVTDEGTQALEPSDFTANLKARPAPIRLSSGQDWRAAYSEAQEVQVDFIAGYGPTPDDIPMPIRQALLLLIAHSYEYRGEADIPQPLMVDALLMPYQGLRL